MSDDKQRDDLDYTAGLTQAIAALDEATATASRARRHTWLRLQRAGITYPTIADRCGVSTQTVNKELARARREE